MDSTPTHAVRRWLASTALLAGLLVGALGDPAVGRATGPALPLAARAFIPFVANCSPPTDPRFGVIVNGADHAANALCSLGLAWWYSYGQNVPNGPTNNVAQIAVNPTGQCCVRVPVDVLQSGARAHPGAAWLIGNEPNVAGQDNVSPNQYATELQYYVNTIKAADPTAQIVGPNVLMWDTTCVSGCEFTPGHIWVDGGTDQGSTVVGLRQAWANQFGGEPPIDVWGIHAYAIDWNHTPMDSPADLQAVENDLTSFSSYLGGISAEASKSIWLTEFGIIWAYQGWDFTPSGCSTPPSCVAPTGSYDSTGVTNYLSSIVGWLTSSGSAARYDRWFAYISYGSPEPYATTYAGISFMTDASAAAGLSPAGTLYRQLAAASQSGAQQSAARGRADNRPRSQAQAPSPNPAASPAH